MPDLLPASDDARERRLPDPDGATKPIEPGHETHAR